MCLSLPLTACGGPRQELFLGTVQPSSGVCGLSAAAGATMHGTLSIRGDAVVFAPETGVLSLHGRIDNAGHITAGQTLPGADRKPFAMAFAGDRKGDAVTGIYATPRCRAEVSLSRSG